MTLLNVDEWPSEGILLPLLPSNNVRYGFFCYCSILSDLLTNVKNPLDEDRLKLTMDTIDIILNDKKTRPTLGDRM